MCFWPSPRAILPCLKVAILDGVAQLWEHSPQWFCLVCKHLLEIGVLTPATVVYYVFREDNSNAIALSPFLWEVRLLAFLHAHGIVKQLQNQQCRF